MRIRTLMLAGAIGLSFPVLAAESGLDVQGFERATGLRGEVLAYGERLGRGEAPPDFERHTGAPYRPSHNEDPAIPPQCWIETSYGTQNACKYCHTTEMARLGHGNAWPMAETLEAQVLYSFPTPNLNAVHWQNIIHPQRLIERLREADIAIPQPGDPENLRYVRTDNWRDAYARARPDGDATWDNRANPDHPLRLLPALDPDHLYPYRADDPTGGGRHGYVDPEGFVRDEAGGYTGWRAVNFFPYAIFTPLGGSVSGIYIRLPEPFMRHEGEVDIAVLRRNLDLLVRNIQDRPLERERYFGDAGDVPVKEGFYPVGTEFAHPLHYVDRAADGERGTGLDGVQGEGRDYEFPGTRSKRVKEVRYMYKWQEVGLADLGPDEESEGAVLGRPWQGWIDNKAGWVLAAYIEDRAGRLRPQSTEELLQCLGCHSAVGNTVDSVWSLQRKLPGPRGWGEMDYGDYRSAHPARTRLPDYRNPNLEKGELEYFYWSVVGADLFGVMPAEIKTGLTAYAKANGLPKKLGLEHPLERIFDDAALKDTPETRRRTVLTERARIMRHYADRRAYLYRDPDSGEDFIKGNIFYPSPETVRNNIAAYRRIVLDQSFNLGKNTFGTEASAVPFTFRSDGSVVDAEGEPIPVGAVIDSRPWGPDGVGITPTGIAQVNDEGEPVDAAGEPVDALARPEAVAGHIDRGGTFDLRYNPILSGEPVRRD